MQACQRGPEENIPRQLQYGHKETLKLGNTPEEKAQIDGSSSTGSVMALRQRQTFIPFVMLFYLV
mgnify:CR=1 FL=1